VGKVSHRQENVLGHRRNYHNESGRCIPLPRVCRYVCLVRLFHDIVGFQKIGVAHEDSEEGRIYANLGSLERVAQERGFEIVVCYARDVGVDKDGAADRFRPTRGAARDRR
jgi:hypothetical protein